MATLAEATAPINRERYEPTTRPTPSGGDVKAAQAAPNFLRCPLPPVSVTPDSLRQFDMPGIPQTRTMTPSQPTNNGGASSGSTTTVIGTGGSSSAGTTGSSVAAQTIQNASVTTPVLNQGQSIQVSVSMATVFALLHVTVNAPARIRMYSTKAAQVADLGRSQTSPVVPGSESGIIADFLLLAPNEMDWTCSPIVIGFNDDNTRVSTIYVTVTNPVGSSTILNVSFSFAVIQA
jgi:hypothetical protein